MLNLFSERQNPDYGSDNHNEQLGMMLVSIATSIMVFMLTVAGAGSALAGCKLVTARVSEAGAAALRLRRSTAGTSVVPIPPALMLQQQNVSGVRRFVTLHTGWWMSQMHAVLQIDEWYLQCAEGGAGGGVGTATMALEGHCVFKREFSHMLSRKVSDSSLL